MFFPYTAATMAQRIIDFFFSFFYRMQLEQNNTEDSNSMTDSLPEQGKNYWALILGLLCVVVVFGNVLVIASVVREKVLQNVTNFFIVSLAVADLLVAGCVMPFSVYVLVSKDILFSYSLLSN